MNFDLSLLDRAVAERSNTWQGMGFTCLVDHSPDLPKRSAWVRGESEIAAWQVCVWESGEAELEVFTQPDQVTLKHYDLDAATDLDGALDDLQAILAGDAARAIAAVRYTALDQNSRLGRRVHQDFAPEDRANGVLRQLEWLDADLDLGAGSERVQAAVLSMANRDPARLEHGIDLARTDWRDLLVATGLGDEDWPKILDERLGRA